MDYDYIVKNRYAMKILTQEPKEPLESQPIDITFTEYQPTKPVFSIVMPIHNQEAILSKHIQAIFQHTTDRPYELICILDACSDKSEQAIQDILRSPLPPLLTSVLILTAHIPLFETSSDNIGFLCSRGKYLLEIQADLEMTETGYNMKLLQPFLLFPNVIGVSGRCCHGITYNEGVGKLGADIEKPLPASLDKHAFYVAETCNRGPLLLDHEKVRQLGYLDEANYFLDNSDHDLFARAYHTKRWICGYVPIEFLSLLQYGSTRKPRNALNERFFQQYQREKTGNGFLRTYHPTTRPIQKIRLE